MYARKYRSIASRRICPRLRWRHSRSMFSFFNEAVSNRNDTIWFLFMASPIERVSHLKMPHNPGRQGTYQLFTEKRCRDCTRYTSKGSYCEILSLRFSLLTNVRFTYIRSSRSPISVWDFSELAMVDHQFLISGHSICRTALRLSEHWHQ